MCGALAPKLAAIRRLTSFLGISYAVLPELYIVATQSPSLAPSRRVYSPEPLSVAPSPYYGT